MELEESTKVCDSVFDNIAGLQYKCNNVRLNQGGSYIDSPDKIKKS